MITKLKPFIAMRWLTLLLQIATILFSYLAGVFNIGQSQAEITDSYDSLFRPAGYTFSIWGVIYLALLVFCIYQLTPVQKEQFGFERLNKYVRFNALMGIIWQFCFRNNWIPASSIIIIMMLISSIVLFSRSHFLVNRRHFASWITVPFSMNLAWVSVATIANISLWLRYRDIWWNGAGISAETWVIIMLFFLLLITQSIASNFRDYVFPLVICWAGIGIWVALKNNDVLSSKASLGGAIYAFLVAVYTFLKKQKIIGQNPDTVVKA